MSTALFLVAILYFFVGLFWVVYPQNAIRLRYGWMFRGAATPSKSAILFTRVMGIVFLLALTYVLWPLLREWYAAGGN